MIKKETLGVLEFDKILAAISGLTHSDDSLERVHGICPLEDRQEIESRFGLVGEIRRLRAMASPLEISGFTGITRTVHQLGPEGSAAEPPELLAVCHVLKMTGAASALINKEIREGWYLTGLAGGLTGFPLITKRIEDSIDHEGNIKDTASTRLYELRTKIRGLQARISRKLETMVRDERTSVFLQDDFISRRSGRWVLPVRMDAKGQVPGVAHDVSRSGETAFIEPLEIIGPTNELENLEADARAEEIRILREICREIRAQANGILKEYDVLVTLDVLSAIALFADTFGLNTPEINTASFIRLSGARHPLLMLYGKKENEPSREVVPLDLELGGETRTMVITGPNAGGKTIAIKTAGLLMLMALSGIPIPAEPSSTIPLLDEIIADIGDEQSIEESLSTFSAHISNLSGIIKRADARMVILMDELGTGTDPGQGAALACAILKDLKQKGALVLATTHLMDIVGFVQRTEGIVNASMEFSPRTLTPMYKLKVGEPGQSRALETALRLGMPGSIVEEAKRLLGTNQVELQELIGEMKEKSALYDESLEELKRRQAGLEARERLFEEGRAKEDRRGKEALANAYEEAGRIVIEARRQVNALVEEAKREKKARGASGARETLKKLSLEQQRIGNELDAISGGNSKINGAVLPGELREGDVVYARRSFGANPGVVIRVDERLGRVRIKTGGMYADVPIADISAASPKDGPGAGNQRPSGGGVNLIKEEQDAAPVNLNLIGARVDEALSRLEPFLNDASIMGLKEVMVIHGMGTGQLMRAVRGYIKGHPLVESFRGGEPFEGREGVTVITIR